MICDNCKTDFQPRRAGRRQKFCPGGQCRREFEARARAAGAQVLRKRAQAGARWSSDPLIERMEREAEAAGVPGMYARPGSRSAPSAEILRTLYKPHAAAFAGNDVGAHLRVRPSGGPTRRSTPT